MAEIRSILSIAARRLAISSLLGRLHGALVLLAIVALALLAAERVGPRLFIPWPWVLPALAAAALAVAIPLWYRARRSDVEVAVEVDDRLDLREKLSTALFVRDRVDPFAQAAVQDAVAAARDPRTRELVRRKFPVTSPPRWWIGPLLVLAAAGAWFIPPQDIFARQPDDETLVGQTVRDRDDAIEAVLEPIERNPELRGEFSDLLGELSDKGTDPEALRTRQDVQRDAVKKLTDLNRRLDEIVNGPKGKTADSVEKALEQLRAPDDGPAKDLTEALARGDFKAAKEALDKVLAKASKGTDEERKQLAQQLKDVAAQLEQLAQQQQQVEDLLRNAGMNPQLAQNPQALQQAIQDNPNLNEQQKQQLQQMMEAQQAAGQMCQGLGQGLGQMAQGMMQGGAGEAGQGGQASQNMGDQLNEMEALQQMLQEARAAMEAAQGQCQGIGQGLGMEQAMQEWLQGRGAFGGPGQGEGGQAPVTPTPTGTKTVKSPTPTTAGDIIARQFIDGPQIVGESRAEIKQVTGAVSEGYEEALGEDQLPRKYHEAHLHYFGELKKLVEAVQQKAADAEEPAAPPAEPAKPADGDG